MLLERLSKQSGKSISELMSFSKSARRRYKVYEIRRASGKGTRTIEQPAKSIKAAQRWLMKSLFSDYPVHPSAMAYRKNISIRTNASVHTEYRYTLRLDFKDFFWSFTSADIRHFFLTKPSPKMLLTDDDITFVVNLVTRNGRLTMGAPSSPQLTNIMMYDFDCHIASLAAQNYAIYTRYADDVYLSSNLRNKSMKLRDEVDFFLERFETPKLLLNKDKTLFLSKKISPHDHWPGHNANQSNFDRTRQEAPY